jgi:paraquat-inducible protein B
MSKKVNPTLIGFFIVAGVALGVGALLLMGATKLFSPTRECIVYFNESLNGLNEGAPVKYRGVTIGTVKRVMVHYNQGTNDYAMPVIIELQERMIEERLGEHTEIFSERALDERIKRGLRASLQSESLVTGVLYIDMRTNPRAPAPVYHQVVKKLPEIPTEPTEFQQMFSKLANLDIKGLETNLNAVLAKVDTVLGSLKLGEITTEATNALHSVERLASSPEITNTLVSVRAAMERFEALAEKLNQRIDPVADGLTNTLAQANLALSQVRGAAENMRMLVSPDSPVRYNLDQALQQLAAAMESVASLADFLKQHPNSLITGRRISEKKP